MKRGNALKRLVRKLTNPTLLAQGGSYIAALMVGHPTNYAKAAAIVAKRKKARWR